MRRISVLILLSFTLQAGWVMAQNAETRQPYPGKPLIVGFSTSSLDVVKRENPRWLKSYIDFWDLIAQELKRPYVFKAMPFEEILKALREGCTKWKLGASHPLCSMSSGGSTLSPVVFEA